jgi:hypothetical protein
VALNPIAILDAFRRLSVSGGSPSADTAAFIAWLDSLPAEVDTRVALPGPRASVAQAADYTLAATDKGAADEAAGPLNVAVPAAATLGDPWTYRLYVASGGASLVGAQATVPVSSGATAFLSVANGKVYSTVGSTTTRVA